MRHMLLVPLILAATCAAMAAVPARAVSAAAVAKPAEVRTTLPPTPQQLARVARSAELKQAPSQPARLATSRLAPKPWRPVGLKPKGSSTIRTRPDGPLTPAQLRKAASGPASVSH